MIAAPCLTKVGDSQGPRVKLIYKSFPHLSIAHLMQAPLIGEAYPKGVWEM